MDRNKQIVKFGFLGILLNLFLTTIKIIVGLLSLSISVVLDAINNLTDALSSILTIIGVKLSNRRPDKKHPYGHGRIEYIVSLVIGFIILATGLVSGYESILKIIEPVEAKYSIITVIVMIIGIIVKVVYGLVAKRKGQELSSTSLKASGIDALSDAVLTFSVLVTIAASLLWSISLEGYLGVIISIFIIKSALSIIIETINDIIGTMPKAEDIEKLKKIILSFEEVHGVYDCVLHNYGPTKQIATAHIQVRDNMTALEIHRITRKIQVKVYEELGIVITIGIYADNTFDEFNYIKESAIEIINGYPSIIQFHGFYVDVDLKLITFDLIFSFEEKESEQKVKEIEKLLNIKYPDYNFHIIIDVDYSE